LKGKIEEYLRELKLKGEELRENAEQQVEELKEMTQQSFGKV
jgi:hypothetical protein